MKKMLLVMKHSADRTKNMMVSSEFMSEGHVLVLVLVAVYVLAGVRTHI